MKEKRKFSYIIKYYDNMSNTVSIVLYDINKKKALKQFRRYYGGYTIISIEGE